MAEAEDRAAVNYDDAEEQLLGVLEGSAMGECQMAASAIRKRREQVKELLSEQVPERDRLVARIYEAQQERDAAKAENAQLWTRMEQAEDEAAAYKKLAGQLARDLDVTDWDGAGNLCHGSVDGYMVAPSDDIDLDLLRPLAHPRET